SPNTFSSRLALASDKVLRAGNELKLQSFNLPPIARIPVTISLRDSQLAQHEKIMVRRCDQVLNRFTPKSASWREITCPTTSLGSNLIICTKVGCPEKWVLLFMGFCFVENPKYPEKGRF